MKPVRIIALGLIGVFLARQLQGNPIQQQLQGGQRPLPKPANGNGSSTRSNAPTTANRAQTTSGSNNPSNRTSAPASADRETTSTGTKLTNNTP